MRKLIYKDPKRADPKVIGQRIRDARERAGLTQTDLGTKVGTSQQTIEKIELGKVSRSSFIYPIYEVLGLTGAPLHNYDPAPRHGEIDFLGDTFRVRREYLGLDPSELAVLSTDFTAEEINAIETRGELSSSGPIEDRLYALDRLLSRLESREPLGEPLAPFNCNLSALPSVDARVPYFSMNAGKGLAFEGYISTPSSWGHNPPPNVFCLSTAPWVRGLAAGGDRIYARPILSAPARGRTIALAVKKRQRPHDVEVVLIGEIEKTDRKLYTLNLGGEETIEIDLSDWDISEILDGAWSYGTLQKLTAAK